MDSLVLVGYDGSASADHALRAARSLLATSSVLIVTVWEPALATAPLWGDPLFPGEPSVDPKTIELLDDNATARAQKVVDRGVALATSLGFTAEGVTAPDDMNVPETLAELARQHGVSAIVLGSHGHTALHARVLGTTGTSLLRHAHCPVIVVPKPERADG